MAPEFLLPFGKTLRKAWSRLSADKPKTRKRRQPRHRRFGFEPLEHRRVLAATDLASVMGLVFEDATGDGFTAGEEVAGATVNLYQDNTNGVFEPGAGDPLVATRVTNAAGEYRFDFLTAGSYWVHQPAQTVGATTLQDQVSPLITITPSQAEGVTGATVIDPFNVTQQSVSSAATNVPATSSAIAPEAIGGARDLYVELTSATGAIAIDVNGLIPERLDSQASSSATGIRRVTWDGPDGDATLLTPTGLGGIDLTNNGTDQAFNLTVAANKLGGQVMLAVYSDATNFSTFTFDIDDIDGTANEIVPVKFTEFVVAGGTGADFTNVGAIQMDLIANTVGLAAQLDLVGTLAPTVFTQDFDNFIDQADLSVTKVVDDPTPNVNDTITFTITLANLGPAPATNVALTESLPSGYTFVSAMPSAGSYDAGTGVWTVGSLAPSGNETLELAATVTSAAALAGPQANVVNVTASDQVDPVPGNNQASVVVTPQIADLSLTKTVDNLQATVNEDVTFTVTLANAGPNAATNVQVTDQLPAGLSFVSATPAQGAYDPGTGVWTVGTIGSTATTSLQIVATVQPEGPWTNFVQVTASDQFDPQSDNNQASAVVTPEIADLAVAKSVDDATPNVGSNITYTINVSNLGPDAATNVALTESLPAGYSFVSANATQGVYNDATGVWTIGTVPSSSTASLQITALVTSAAAQAGPQANLVEITAPDQFDPDPANNQASVVVTPQVADLAVAKSVDDATPNVGSNVTYTIIVSNLGPNAATNVALTESLPAGYSFVSANATQGSYSNATGVWTIGTVAGNGTASLQVTALVTSAAALAGPQANMVAITAADQFDPDMANNQASVVVTPQVADLAVAKSVDEATPNVGSNVTYTINVSNLGPDAATNVALTESLPAGYSFVSVNATQGVYSNATGVWTIGTVPSSGTASLQVVALVTSAAALAGPQANMVAITAADQFDPQSDNNQASVVVTPQVADLSLTKTADNTAANVGSNVTFTIVVSNAGPNAATNVEVTDQLSPGLSFVSATPDQGVYDAGTGVWTVGTISSGENATLQIVATVLFPGPWTNTAQVTASDQFDPDSTPGEPGQDDSDTVTIVPPIADLSVTKTVDNPAPNVGSNIIYTVTLANAGPHAATNVALTDELPAGYTFVSSMPSVGTYDAATGVWTVGALMSGGNATLQLTALVTSAAALAGPQANSVAVTAADPFDPVPDNNQASVVVTPQVADLSLTKSADTTAPNVGSNVTFTIVVSNAGPNAATNVQVTDQLPAGLTLVSATPAQGVYNSATGVWTVGTIPSSATATLQLVATVETVGPLTNIAQVTASDQFDPDSTPGVPNQDDSDAVTLAPPVADLAVTKSVDDDRPNVGSNITFTINVTNLGPAAATNVALTESLPPGYTIVTASATQGAFNAATGVWTVGTVPSTGTASLQVSTLVTATAALAGAQSNLVQVTAADQFDPVPGNNQASVVVTPQVADLSLTQTVDNPTPNIGDNITLTVTVLNSGPDAATNVVVSNPIPPGVSFVASSPSQGVYDPATGFWTVGTLAPGATATWQLTVSIDTGGVKNFVAQVWSVNQFDPDSTPGNSVEAEDDQQTVTIRTPRTLSKRDFLAQ